MVAHVGLRTQVLLYQPERQQNVTNHFQLIFTLIKIDNFKVFRIFMTH